MGPDEEDAASSTRPPVPSRRRDPAELWGTGRTARVGGGGLPRRALTGPQILMVGGSTPRTPITTTRPDQHDPAREHGERGDLRRAAQIRKRSHVNTTILPDGTLFTNGGGAGSIGGDQYAGPVYTAELLAPGRELDRDPRRGGGAHLPLHLAAAPGRPGGDDGRRPHRQPAENGALRTVEYCEPPYLFKGARPSIGYSSPSGAPYAVPVGIGTADGGMAKAVLLKLGATRHATDADQRSLSGSCRWLRSPGTLSSITTPSNPNAAPPGYYMLFLVNSAGVPSVAKMIRLDSGRLPAPPAVAARRPAAAGSTRQATRRPRSRS